MTDKERLYRIGVQMETYVKILHATDDGKDRSTKCKACSRKVHDAFYGCCAPCLQLAADALKEQP